MITGKRSFTGLLAIMSVLVLYVWDDALLAAPVVAATRVVGVLPTFLFFTTAYWLGSWAIAILAVRAFDRRGNDPDSKTRVQRWVESQAVGRRGPWVDGLLRGGRVIGFVACSFLLGGIVTTCLLRYAGQRERIGLMAASSSAIFAVSFVGLYSGLGRLLLGRS